jgi:hypothetical protein
VNCLEGAAAGEAMPAVGVCHDCGAGVCLNHLIASPRYLTRTMTIAMEVNVEPPARVVRCELCRAASEAAGGTRSPAARNRALERGR